MVINRKVTGTASSMPAGLTVGTIISLLFTAIGVLSSAWLISSARIPQEAIGYCVMVILILGSALGAWVSVKKIKHRRLMVCALSAFIYFTALIASNILFFGGIYSGVGVTALLIFCGSMIVALSGARGDRGPHSGKRKRKRC